MQGEPLKGYKHWFDPAVRQAGISVLVLLAAHIREPFGDVRHRPLHGDRIDGS
jgi:hypothetical protein